MTNEEYINSHPEQFKDDIDKWLFTEFGIIGGCCSAEKNHEYHIARMVAEKFEDERLKHCDELTPEQAQLESDFVVSHLKKHKRTPTFIDAVEYGWDKAIEKACEWLQNHNDYQRIHDNGRGVRFDMTQCVIDFRKAMEE